MTNTASNFPGAIDPKTGAYIANPELLASYNQLVTRRQARYARLSDTVLLDLYDDLARERCRDDDEFGDKLVSLDAANAECVRRGLTW